MHIKAKTLHFIYAKKLKIVQIQEKSLWCILNKDKKVVVDTNVHAVRLHFTEYTRPFYLNFSLFKIRLSKPLVSLIKDMPGKCRFFITQFCFVLEGKY